MLTTVLVAGFVLLRRAWATQSLSGFVVAGRGSADPAGVPNDIPVVPGSGYDGQFVYRLALRPWTTVQTAFGIRLDDPAYRQQRIVTPLAAWLLARLPGVSTAVALVLVNALALVVASWFGARIAVALGRSRWWGLVVALPAGIPISLGRDLTEPVAWAAMLAGLWYAQSRRWPAAAVALTVAVLARETALLVVVGLGAAYLLGQGRDVAQQRRREGGGLPGLAALPARTWRTSARRSAAWRSGGWLQASPGWLAVPVTAAAGWQLVLWRVWGELPIRSGGSNNLGGSPVAGVARAVVRGMAGYQGSVWADTSVRSLWALERVALVVLFGYAAVAVVRGSSGVGLGVRIAWALAALLAVSLRDWSDDAQFLRPLIEAIGLSLLVTLGVRGRVASIVLAGAAVLTCCVAIEYTQVL